MTPTATEAAIRSANPVPDETAPPAGVVDSTAVLAAVERRSGRQMPAASHGTTPTSALKWAAASATLVIVLIGAVALIGRTGDVSVDLRPSATAAIDGPAPPTTTAAAMATHTNGAIVPRDVGLLPQPGRAMPTAGTPLPDIANAVVADDERPRLPIVSVEDLPNEHRLDFLFELCDADGMCIRDAHFMDPVDPVFGSGGWPAGRPFHIRHGFPAGPEPFGPEFDLAVYAQRITAPSEVGGVPSGATLRFTTDFVMRGEVAYCGPEYRAQTAPLECEWFVHDFPEGLPEGRWAIWAVWEAPCGAWVNVGLATSCIDPNEVVSYFSSGFDTPFFALGSEPITYNEPDAAALRRQDVMNE